MSKSVSFDFWDDFQKYIGQTIPNIIVKTLLKITGYDSAILINKISYKDVDIIEKFANDHLKDELKDFDPECNVFSFVPGHRRTIVEIGKLVDGYISKHSKQANDSEQNLNLSQASPLLNEFITWVIAYGNVAPVRRRYSEILQWFGI